MCECGSTASGAYMGKIGGQIGDRLQLWGESVVSNAQKRFKSWTGLGDYKLSQNSLIQGGGPLITQQGSLLIYHKEYLGDVTTGSVVGGFNSRTYAVNPANVLTFPWGSNIAQQYEQYRPRGIIFEFKSTATELTSAVSLGSILMAADYDNNDVPFTSKADMLNTAFSQEAKMSNDAVHGIECDPRVNGKSVYFTRTLADNVTNRDLNDYDVCKFTIATSGGGLAANSVVGSLYVHYEFELLKEQIYGGLPMKDLLHCNFKTVAASGRMWGDMPKEITSGTDLGITFPEGLQRIAIPKTWAGAVFNIEITYLVGSNFAMGAVTAPTLTNCSFVATSGDSATSAVAGLLETVPPTTTVTLTSYTSWMIKIDDILASDALINFASYYAMHSTGSYPCTLSFRFTIVDKLYSD